MTRRIGRWLTVAMFVAGAAAVVWWVWHAESVRPFGRVLFTIVSILLVALPSAARLVWGPVAPSFASRAVRLAGYALVCALIPVLVRLVGYINTGKVDRPEQRVDSGEVANSVFLVLLIVGYAVAILALTSRRAAIPARTLVLGAGFGVLTGLAGYGLIPFGSPFHLGNGWLTALYVLAFPLTALGLPAVAGKLAVGDNHNVLGEAQARQALLAGVLTGIVAALLIAVCAISTVLSFPARVALEPDGLGAPPDPAGNLHMSVGDAAGNYLIVLVFGPGLTAIAGTAGTCSRRRRQPIPIAVPPEMTSSGA
jgi:hypothetical protein